MNNSCNQDENHNINALNKNLSDIPSKTLQSPIITEDNKGYNAKQIFSVKKIRIKQKKDLTRGFISVAVIVIILFSGVAGFGGTYLVRGVKSKPIISQTDSSVENSSGITSDNDGVVIFKSAVSSLDEDKNNSNTISSVAVKAADSVVSITTETAETSTIFGQYISSGAGSGVIITDNGYIITCAHVIDGSSNITIKLTDGKEYKAFVVGSDSITDIAIVKIDMTGLSYAIIGDSDSLIVGETAIAIGNPLGELGGTVTNGIISALNRDIDIGGQSYNLLQTNAAINPGNSGGGLFNFNGELIGIVNAKSSGDDIEGLGFAIPINDAINIAKQLIDYGYIKGRPQLGIYAIDITRETDPRTIRSSEYADIINYITDYGIYFIGYNDKIQTKGEFQFGDQIIALDGIEVSSKSILSQILNSEYIVGDTVIITVSRLTDKNSERNEMIDVEIKLIESVPDNSSVQLK